MVDEINIETNYDIDVKKIKLGVIFCITFSNGTFSFGGSDEHTESIVTAPEIVFKVAWIKNDIYSKDTYEDALDFWLT